MQHVQRTVLYHVTPYFSTCSYSNLQFNYIIINQNSVKSKSFSALDQSHFYFAELYHKRSKLSCIIKFQNYFSRLIGENKYSFSADDDDIAHYIEATCANNLTINYYNSFRVVYYYIKVIRMKYTQKQCFSEKIYGGFRLYDKVTRRRR